jgi:Ca2+-binding RTX toxin-like protein
MSAAAAPSVRLIGPAIALVAAASGFEGSLADLLPDGLDLVCVILTEADDRLGLNAGFDLLLDAGGGYDIVSFVSATSEIAWTLRVQGNVFVQFANGSTASLEGVEELRSADGLFRPELGEFGAWEIRGSDAVDALLGTGFGDHLYGEGGADRLDGGGGNDQLDGGAGADEMHGGRGDDIFQVNDPGDQAIEGEGEGTDVVYSSVSFSLAGQQVEVLALTGAADLSAIGNALANLLLGNVGANLLVGMEGEDKLDGGFGADTMRGGNGDDVYYVDNVGDVVVELANEGIDTIWTSLLVYSLVGSEIERLGANSDVAHDFRGNAGNNVVSGGAGNDFLRLHDGGTDTAIGGLGNDVFLFGGTLTSADSIDGGAGIDQIAIQGNYSGGLTFGSNVVGIENLAILPGNDTRFGDPGTNLYDYVLTATNAMVAAGVQLVVDANRLRPGEDFTFDGSAETDGSFFIYGGGGVDTLTGGANKDVFIFGGQNQWGASDVVTGGAGTDQLALRGNYTIVFGANQLVGIEQIGMVSAQDTRYGLLGSSYSYNLTMVDANVDGIQMTVDAAPLWPGETLTFNGSAEDDGSFRVFGGRGNDTITGSRNGDIIAGNAGADMLTGGGGGDAFRYVATTDSMTGGVDKILDFLPGTDWIDLSRIDADTNVDGNQAFHWIGSNAFGTSGTPAGELRAYQSGNSWFVEGDTNGDGMADLIIEVVTAAPLEQSHFLL